MPTDPTTRAQWRAEAKDAVDYANRFNHGDVHASRVIALCNELEAIEDLPERQAHKITLAILMDTEAALAEYERDLGKRDEWEPGYQATIRKLSDGLAAAQAEVERLRAQSGPYEDGWRAGNEAGIRGSQSAIIQLMDEVKHLEFALAAARIEIARLEKLAYLPNEQGGPSIETYQAEMERLKTNECHHGWRGTPLREQIANRCPACGGQVFIGQGGHLTCAYLECPDPGEPSDALNQFKTLREDAALLEGLIGMAAPSQIVCLSHEAGEWEVSLEGIDPRSPVAFVVHANTARDAIRAALAQAKGEKP